MRRAAALVLIALGVAMVACKGMTDADCGGGQVLWTCRVHILPGMMRSTTCSPWEQDVTVCALNGMQASVEIVDNAATLVQEGYYRNVGVHACWRGTSSDVTPAPGPLAWCDPEDPTCDPSAPPPDACTCGP